MFRLRGPQLRLSVLSRQLAAAADDDDDVGEGVAEIEGPIEELGQGDLCSLPIFVLQPTLPWCEENFHIYEPRYRLMLQRCLQQHGPAGQRGEFGMCWPVSASAFSDVGTLLRVTGHTQLADGRSNIRCIGVRRFRVLKRGLEAGVEATTQQRAEYNTAQIEWLEDEDSSAAPEPQEGEVTSARARIQLLELHDELIRAYPAPVAKLLLLKIHGPDSYARVAQSLDAGETTKAMIDAPTDDTEFVWWCLGLVMSITQLSHNLKAAVVSSRSAAKRQALASDVLSRVQTMLAEAEGEDASTEEEDDTQQ